MTFQGRKSALIFGFCAAGLMLGGSMKAQAQSISVVVDGNPVEFANSPFEQNGSVLVPLRGVFEKLGAQVNYNADTRTIEATQGQTDVVLHLGESTAYIDQQPQTLAQPPVVVNGATFVPLRFVAQSFGAQVNWIADTETVQIQTSASTAGNGGDEDQDNEDEDNGPVRLARFSNVDGNVTWRPADGTDWSDAAPNIPLREGAEIWNSDGGRAEIQFDDGSWLRLGDDTIATLQTLSSNSDGEYTEIELNEGTAFLHLVNSSSTYQVDTTLVSVKATGYSKIRIDNSDGIRIAVRDGSAQVAGGSGNDELQSGSYLQLASAGDIYNVGALPALDDEDHWNDTCDGLDTRPTPNLPPNIALVAGNMDQYGDWHNDPQYGNVWTPRENDPDWRPYEHGHWVWVHPFGWTWVADEPWGWAPYHYGTWVQGQYGWSWVPGPSQQYWSPAVVHFTEYQGNVCWAPLAPAEVHYPPHIAVAVGGHDWSLNFSIGGCAVYTPRDSHSCAPQPWSNRQINAPAGPTPVQNIFNNTTVVQNITNVTNVNVTKYVFVPQNAAGATSTSTSTFGSGGGGYRPVRDPTGIAFRTGQPVVAQSTGGPPTAGPVNIPPTRQSLTPTRVFKPAPPTVAAIVNRTLFHAPPPPGVRTASTGVPPSGVNAPPAPAPYRAHPIVTTTPRQGGVPTLNRTTTIPSSTTSPSSPARRWTQQPPTASTTSTPPARTVIPPTVTRPVTRPGYPVTSTTPTAPVRTVTPPTITRPVTRPGSQVASTAPSTTTVHTVNPATPPRPGSPPTTIGPSRSTSPTIPSGQASRPFTSAPPRTQPAALPVPRVTGVSPAAGKPGTTVTITGSNLTAVRGLSFNGANCAFTVRNPSTITATAPNGVTSGPIRIVTQGGQTITVGNFTAQK